MHSMQMFELIIAMLLAIILLHYVANRLRLPPAAALLAGGALCAFVPGLPVIDEHRLKELERDLDLEELSALSAKA